MRRVAAVLILAGLQHGVSAVVPQSGCAVRTLLASADEGIPSPQAVAEAYSQILQSVTDIQTLTGARRAWEVGDPFAVGSAASSEAAVWVEAVGQLRVFVEEQRTPNPEWFRLTQEKCLAVLGEIHHAVRRGERAATPAPEDFVSDILLGSGKVVDLVVHEKDYVAVAFQDRVEIWDLLTRKRRHVFSEMASAAARSAFNQITSLQKSSDGKRIEARFQRMETFAATYPVVDFYDLSLETFSSVLDGEVGAKGDGAIVPALDFSQRKAPGMVGGASVRVLRDRTALAVDENAGVRTQTLPLARENAPWAASSSYLVGVAEEGVLRVWKFPGILPLWGFTGPRTGNDDGVRY